MLAKMVLDVLALSFYHKLVDSGKGAEVAKAAKVCMSGLGNRSTKP